MSADVAPVVADALPEADADGEATTSSSVVAQTWELKSDGPLAVTLFIRKQYSVAGVKLVS